MTSRRPNDEFLPDAALVEMRIQLSESMHDRPPAPNVRQITVHEPTVEMQVFEPLQFQSMALYVHGGGFRMGSPQGIAPYLSHLANKLECKIFAVQYALAPEHPFPAGLRDVTNAWQSIKAEADKNATPVFIIGDSAGAGLASSLVTDLLKRQEAIPSCVVLMSPWVDLRVVASSFDTCATSDPVFSHAKATVGADMYLQGHDPLDPRVSPVFGDWTGTPPVLIQYGDTEVLSDDSRALANRITEDGGTVVLDKYSAVNHVWQYQFPETDASREAVNAINSFLQRHLR